jgi:hypothetical protein
MPFPCVPPPVVACSSGWQRLGAMAETSRVSDVRQDQEIRFFPAMAAKTADGAAWELEIRGCIFEPEKRRLALAMLRRSLAAAGVRMSAAENVLLEERARLFMVDNERGKRVFARLGRGTYLLGKSRADGTFSGTVRISGSEMDSLIAHAPGSGGIVHFSAALSPGDRREFKGRALLFHDEGLTVISDIDDTIKITQVRDRKATLASTFLKPFQPVPGMADLYRNWARQPGARFCYVSAGPWQLYEPLAAFTEASGFPKGVFFFRSFRWKDESLFNLLRDPRKYKEETIAGLIERFPRRRFLLVGDSGERDPEVYAAVARRYPEQVAGILIRNVTGEAAGSPRYQSLSGNLPARLFHVFDNPSDLGGAVPGTQD